MAKFILVEYAHRNLKHIQFDKLRDAQKMMVERFNEVLAQYPKFDDDLTYVDETDARIATNDEMFLWDIIIVQ